MVAVKPALASYARIAYARELTGDRPGAISAMTLALDAAGGAPEPTAWTHVELAKLELGSGRVRSCLAARGRGTHDLPRLRPCARAACPDRGGARASSARPSRPPSARRPPCRCRSSSRSTASSSTDRGGRRRRGGSVPSWRRSTDCSRRTGSASTSSRPSSAPIIGSRRRRRCALARRARADRPSIHGDDALGWALARAGRCARGDALARPRAPARHEGRAPLLPSRLRGRVRRRPPCDARRGTAGRSRSTRASRSAGPRWRRGHSEPNRSLAGGEAAA